MRACIQMLPQLSAKERLDESAAVGIGYRQGAAKRASGVNQALRSFQAAARGRAGDSQGNDMLHGAVGIAVKKVPLKKAR